MAPISAGAASHSPAKAGWIHTEIIQIELDLMKNNRYPICNTDRPAI